MGTPGYEGAGTEPTRRSATDFPRERYGVCSCSLDQPFPLRLVVVVGRSSAAMKNKTKFMFEEKEVESSPSRMAMARPSPISPSVAGRRKENVSGDMSLRGTAMSASCLSAMSFELPPSFQESKNKKSPEDPDVIYASSSSSTCTRDSEGASSDVDCSVANTRFPSLERRVSEKLNAKVALRSTSRQGRLCQRWVNEGDKTIRLVTGCVPILKGGKILFVSASRKPEWILPKGGWELDETMEESAVRECFEEAGVFGLLGPKLKTIEYETRKAKKRRIEQELSLRSCKPRSSHNGLAFDTDSPSSDDGLEIAPSSSLVDSSDTLSTGNLHSPRQVSHASSPGDAEAAADTYSKVRMTLFPLYVSRVLEKWPEDGRFRKAVDIDEAIELLHSRPELKEMLEEVKARGLHLISHK